MRRAPKRCKKSNPIPNKIGSQKEIIKNSSIPFQLDIPKHNKNWGLLHDIFFFMRAKTSELDEEKLM